MNHYAGCGSSTASRTRIPTLSVIEGAGDSASTFADYGLVRISLGASEKEFLDSPAGHTAILDSGFRGFELPLINEGLIPSDAFRETLKTPLKIRAASGDEILIKETATVFLKVAMAPNEVTLWSGADRQGEKVAIQRSDGKANTPIMAYFLYLVDSIFFHLLISFRWSNRLGFCVDSWYSIRLNVLFETYFL